MKATQTWSFASLLLLAGMSSVSCGKDEVTGGGGGTGTILTGGTGGTAAGTAGTRAMGGSAGSGTAVSATRLGRACVTKADCADANAPNLTCVTSKDTLLGDGAPPKGLCTQECPLPTQDSPTDECEALGTDAVCFPFSNDATATTGYCVEGCSFGKPDIGETKCHMRPEFACNPAFVGKTNTACVAATDCQDGELCSQGFCNVVFPACLPSCRGDVDCDTGMYCDQSFLSGVCVKTKPVGKLLGEPCTVNAPDQPDEPDDCVGYCAPDETGSTQGHCSATCTLGAACAWDPDAKVFDGACLYVSAITGSQNVAAGDFGFCTPTCNCAAECNDPALGCETDSQGKLGAQYRAGGLCFPPGATSIPLDECNGAGGAPDAAGGSPGVAGMGAGGAP